MIQHLYLCLRSEILDIYFFELKLKLDNKLLWSFILVGIVIKISSKFDKWNFTFVIWYTKYTKYCFERCDGSDSMRQSKKKINNLYVISKIKFYVAINDMNDSRWLDF